MNEASAPGCRVSLQVPAPQGRPAVRPRGFPPGSTAAGSSQRSTRLRVPPVRRPPCRLRLVGGVVGSLALGGLALWLWVSDQVLLDDLQHHALKPGDAVVGVRQPVGVESGRGGEPPLGLLGVARLLEHVGVAVAKTRPRLPGAAARCRLDLGAQQPKRLFGLPHVEPHPGLHQPQFDTLGEVDAGVQSLGYQLQRLLRTPQRTLAVGHGSQVLGATEHAAQRPKLVECDRVLARRVGGLAGDLAAHRKPCRPPAGRLRVAVGQLRVGVDQLRRHQHVGADDLRHLEGEAAEFGADRTRQVPQVESLGGLGFVSGGFQPRTRRLRLPAVAIVLATPLVPLPASAGSVVPGPVALPAVTVRPPRRSSHRRSPSRRADHHETNHPGDGHHPDHHGDPPTGDHHPDGPIITRPTTLATVTVPATAAVLPPAITVPAGPIITRPTTLATVTIPTTPAILPPAVAIAAGPVVPGPTTPAIVPLSPGSLLAPVSG